MTQPSPANHADDVFSARTTLDTAAGPRTIYKLDALRGIGEITRLPYSIRVLLEACLRHCDNHIVTEDHVKALVNYDPKATPDQEIPFNPGRVVLQDFTGVPAVVDLAAMRSGIVRMTGDEASAKKVNPLVPCDLVIDHSVQVDAFASGTALTINAEKEFERNNERYEFLKWGQSAFDNFRVVPPATGIVHQVNLEYLAKVVWEDNHTLYPDSLVGTDSHTTMINGLGVVGWGVGGIEAEAVMLGQPIYMLIPQTVGVRLTGKLPEGATATDLVLRVTEMLREHGVVNKFVEFTGPGLDHMPLANRATIANMAPEYGATIGFFPIDDRTLDYMRLTNRDETLIETVKQYAQANHFWRNDSDEIEYTTLLEMDLGTIEPALAGPKRPQDRIALSDMKRQWRDDLGKTFNIEDTTTMIDNPVGGWVEEGGQPQGQTGNNASAPSDATQDATPDQAIAVATPQTPSAKGPLVEYDGHKFRLHHGACVIAAITSCTNTSNPEVMIAAGLLARNANKLGMKRKPWVKTSLAPGSKVVTDYYDKAGLTDDLEALGFHTVGYGCTTCIGNSGPLPEPISQAIRENKLVASAVLSGNRNFEGRISPDVKANYLASPPLVVAYALAGTVDLDLTTQPLGKSAKGEDVYLKDLWPSQAEIQEVIAASVTREQFENRYANVFHGPDEWRAIQTTGGNLYDWNPSSTYVQEPPFFIDMPVEAPAIASITGARCLVKVGDSVTTDHISPAGAIKTDAPAGKYLQDNGVPVSMFNSYGARRGNDRVMVRGTFANIRVKNQLAPGTEGGFTTNLNTGQVGSIFDTAVDYGAAATSETDLYPTGKPKDAKPLVVLAGKDYGMGSSRDWAAKGTILLGVKAVIATSYERIHRSNLVGMGVLPLQFKDGDTHETLKLTGREVFDITVPEDLKPSQDIDVTATDEDGNAKRFTAVCRIDTPVEITYYQNGGILHTVLRRMAES